LELIQKLNKPSPSGGGFVFAGDARLGKDNLMQQQQPEPGRLVWVGKNYCQMPGRGSWPLPERTSPDTLKNNGFDIGMINAYYVLIAVMRN